MPTVIVVLGVLVYGCGRWISWRFGQTRWYRRIEAAALLALGLACALLSLALGSVPGVGLGLLSIGLAGLGWGMPLRR
jgi:hypothetical protein